MATHSSVLAWRLQWTEEPGGYSPWGHRESDTTGETQRTGARACGGTNPGKGVGSGLAASHV